MKDNKEITNRIQNVQFGYYTSQEIRKLSVKEINNPLAFDQLQRPLANGLYDPSLGISPYEKFSRCQTCGQEGMNCQGHQGHIELLLPVYNPFLLSNMIKLLKSMCIKCNRLRISKEKIEEFIDQFMLIKLGYLSAAEQYCQAINNRYYKQQQSYSNDHQSSTNYESESNHTQSEKVKKKSKNVNQYIKNMIRECLKIKQDCLEKISVKDQPEDFMIPSQDSQQIQRALKQKISELYSSINVMTCPHCNSKSHNIKKEGSSKLFLIRKKGKENSKKKLEEDSHSEISKSDKNKQMYLNPIEVRDYIRKLWRKEKEVLDLMFGTIIVNQVTLEKKQKGYKIMSNDFNMFFIEVVLVTPNRFRPENKLDDQTFLHSHTLILTKIINLNQDLRQILLNYHKPNTSQLQMESNIDNLQLKSQSQIKTIKSELSLQQIVQKWLELQDSVNTLFDSSKANKAQDKETTGIRQLFEKKEGLFRMKMMGKRVNFAARSVISPDPYLDTNEVGVPLFVAKRLTFPEGVNEYNIEQLRRMVINGPYVWPGANSVEENGVRINLESRTKEEREGIAKLLLQNCQNKSVLRHLQSGDVLLFNRQPTLHKPSLMSHIARVLPKENTIRMHYANCSSYNADFDGDEMNLHFVQNHLARSEAYNLSLNDHQYIVAKNGSPIRGLIQDSVLSAAILTSKDTFIARDVFYQLIYISTWQFLKVNQKINMPKPSIIRPKSYYTGKQVITTILKTLIECELGQESDSKKGLYMDKGSKIPGDIFGLGAKDESLLYIQDNELIHGIVDKNQIGSTDYGLVHSFYELYGAKMTGKLLTSLARVFSAYLQFNGFSAGMEDLFLSQQNEIQRISLIHNAHQIGTQASANFVGYQNFNVPHSWKLFNRQSFDGNDDKVYKRKQNIDYISKNHELCKKLEQKITESGSVELDMEVKQQMNVITTDIFKLTNYGLRRQFPQNLFSMMVLTGAKGSNVNHNQISVMLGQQELEGRRVPITITGKTLPCFIPYDPNPRAGGYITDRFLTGLRPQEFFFHCMAGREGLIDTAVKTSRSGYLQRCLVKHLEGLKVCYDYTVRDSDDSILQFHYGEDSLDSTKSKFIDRFNFITNNYNAFLYKYQPKNLTNMIDTTSVKDFLKARKNNPQIYYDQTILNLFYPGSYLGAISEKSYSKIQDFIQNEKQKQIEGKENIFNDKKISDKKLFSLFNIKYFNSLIQPGECVGPIAAQSVGEPSTQMTLNTFHLAGHGGANVTLGIPRLREILMTAAKVIKTPCMTLPFIDPEVSKSKDKADDFCQRLQNINLRELVQKIQVREQIIIANERYKRFRIKITFEDLNAIFQVFKIQIQDLVKVLEKKFILKLLTQIHKEIKKDNSINHKFQSRIVKETENEENDKEEEMQDEVNLESVIMQEEQDSETDVYNTKKQIDLEQKDKKEDKQTKKIKNLEHISKLMLQFFNGMKFKKNSFNIQLKLPLNSKKLLMIQIIDHSLKTTIINEIQGIKRCMVMKDKNKNYVLQSEGVNFYKIWETNYLDLNKIECNDIHQIIQFYGIEAGRQSIINEINRVFSVYHIQVDYRHLSLIADYMCYLGTMRAMNRIGISDHPSSFLKMSFETTLKFLCDATLQREIEQNKSPSAQIILGTVPKVGTGIFDIRYKFKI